MRKGQLTMFIIIALILILGVGVLLYIVQITEEVRIEEIIYPQEIGAVAKFITQCAQSAAKEGVVIMGSQGGFIKFPPEIEFERASYLRMDEFGLYKIPYWFFQGQSRIPPPDLMQTQLSEYIEENTLICIDNFKAFEKQFSIFPQENIKVITTLTDENILVEILYPLLIETKDKQFTTEKYNFFLPVRLKKIHELGSKILEAENENKYFENVTLDIMSSHPDIPMDGMLLSCVQKQWFTPTIKQKLQAALQFNIRKARIKNTGYPPFEADISAYRKLARAYENMQEEFQDGLEDYRQSKYLPKERPSDAWEYFHLFFDVGAAPTDLRVNIEYHPDYGMDLIGNPNDNGILSTNVVDTFGALAGLFCLKQYHFTYDVRYPVKVTIRDPVSFEGQGYNFVFAFPVIIDDNKGERAVTSSIFFPEVGDPTGFCRDVGSELYEFRARSFSEGDLDDAKISYRCFNKLCELGTTTATRGLYRLVTPLPEGCGNPLIIAEKSGYIKDQKYMTGKFTHINLVKLRNFTFSVVKHDYYSQTGTMQSADDLINTEIHKEEAVILLKYKDKNFNQYKHYPDEDNTLQLVDGDAAYDLNIYFLLNDKVVGGYKNDNLQINWNDMTGNHIVFHVFRYHPEDELKTAQYLLSDDYQDQLQPTFENV